MKMSEWETKFRKDQNDCRVRHVRPYKRPLINKMVKQAFEEAQHDDGAYYIHLVFSNYWEWRNMRNRKFQRPFYKTILKPKNG